MQYRSRSGSLALTAATARTVCRVAGTSALSFLAVSLKVTFDGVTATAVPVLCELFTDDGITGGTSASITPRQVRGATVAASVTSASYSVEPTYTNLIVLDDFWIPPTSGIVLQEVLGREPEGQPGAGARQSFGVRLTAPAAVNARTTVEVVQGPS